MNLELQNIYYAINGNPILQDVSLKVIGQETLAILGASGSGKSTILKIILGLAKPDRGRVLINGTDIHQIRYVELVEIRKQLGMVFQEGALFDSLTVGENVGYYNMEHERQTHAAAEPQVAAMLSKVGLSHTIDMMPDELSGGMRRRIAIARALIYHPELILYDEPTTGLDPVARQSIVNLINLLKQEDHVASIIVTHNLDDAAQVADKFLVIREGSMVWQGSKRQFLAKHEKMISQYFQTTEKL